MTAIFGWIGLLLWCVVQLAIAGDVPVHIRLRHGWHNYTNAATHASTFVEMMEAAHEVFPNELFDMVSHVWPACGKDTTKVMRTAGHKDLFDSIEDFLRTYATSVGIPRVEERLDEWRIHVAQHWQAPRVESMYQIFNTSRELQGHSPTCDTFVYFDDRVLCSPNDLRAAITKPPRTLPTVFPHDHVYPSGQSALPALILYADPYSTTFGAFHSELMTLAGEQRIRYVLRWRPTLATVSEPRSTNYFSGFGASMHLKKVDYLVLDDRQIDAAEASEAVPIQSDRIGSLYRDVQDQLYSLGGERTSSVQEAVLKQSNFSLVDGLYLGQAAAHAILTAEDPLSTMESIVHDFPAHAVALQAYAAHLAENDPIIEYLNERNYRLIGAGSSQIWINGRAVPKSDLELLTFFKSIQEERRLLDDFGAPELGVSPEGVESLLTQEAINLQFSPSPRDIVLYDTSDTIEQESGFGTTVIAWINNLESEEYKLWPNTLEMMMEYRWPSGFPLIARNFFQVVMLLDVGHPEALEFMSEALEAMMTDYPFRWGLVPLLRDDASEEIAQVLWHAINMLQPREIAPFLLHLAKGPTVNGRVDPEAARAHLGSIVRNIKKRGIDLVQEFVHHKQVSPLFKYRLELAHAYVERVYPNPRPGTYGVAFLNGQEISLSERFIEDLASAVSYQLHLAHDDITRGRIEKTENYETYFFDLKGTVKERSQLADMLEDAKALLRPYKFVSLPEVFRRLGSLADPLRHFLYDPKAHDSLVSLRVVGDIDSDVGRHSVVEVLKAMEAEGPSFRVSFIHTGADHGVLSHFLLSAMMSGALSDIPPSRLRSAIEAADISSALDALSHEFTSPKSDMVWSQIAPTFVSAAGLDVGLLPTLILNGQVLPHIRHLKAREVTAAVEWEQQKHVSTLLNTLTVPERPRDVRAQVVEFATAILGKVFVKQVTDTGSSEASSNPRVPIAPLIASSPVAFKVGDASAAIHVSVIMDPIAEEAPQLTSILRMLSSVRGVRLSILMNPRMRVTAMPLQRFTRYDVRIRPEFDAQGHERIPGIAFNHLPQQAVLTMQLHAPRSMVTMADEAIYDLDNIRLSDVHGSVDAIYAIKSLLLEGYAQALPNSIPRGLQLVLETDDQSTQLDTIVMENLGYFQFRAQPGHWHLSIREGRSSDVYEMLSVGSQGWRSPPVNETSSSVLIDSRLGLTVFPQFRKRLGKTVEELISERPKDDSGLASVSHGLQKQWGKALRLLRGTKSKHADINIFTLASGHLYERMTYIMILSVLRHTKSSVKFWFVENFLSPSFKAFIPHLAEAYGFKYELITFAWPEWLREQTEKQRMIWAYKILFLDVMFPLDLDRVIFVDADQIVRSDLKELVDMDLRNAPYGYPPMGDDSEDMDGYRFWKKGYWKAFLRGRTYHISALYVVDLQRFRYMAAGDILRRHYQRLTADPNSLANLDQDLPNHCVYYIFLLTFQCKPTYLFTRLIKHGSGARHGALTIGCLKRRPSICAVIPRRKNRNWIGLVVKFQNGRSLTMRWLRWLIPYKPSLSTQTHPSRCMMSCNGITLFHIEVHRISYSVVLLSESPSSICASTPRRWP